MTIPILFVCSNDYNPFDNYLNAQIRILAEKSSIAQNDTISFFTTETLWVYATNREKIQKFTIHADSNRLWKDSTVFCDAPVMEFRFLLSFNDTGTKSISIKTFRTNGDVSYQSPAMSVHVRSPLEQKDIKGVLGIPCTLSTHGVADRVNYIWSFGTYQGKNVSFKKQFAANNEELVQNIAVGITDTGYLWVEDSTGAVHSPKASFMFHFDATIGPSISCISKGVWGNAADSVMTGDDFVDFSVFVADQAGGTVDSVALSGDSFDWVNTDRTIFKKTLTQMTGYTESQPKIETVIAIDKYKNITKRSFALYYDANGPKVQLVQLRLINPVTPIASTRQENFGFLLGVDNAATDSAVISLVVNGTTINPQQSVGKTSANCLWNIPCVVGSNTIRTIAKINQTQYAETTVVILRDPKMLDTTKPQILDITVDNTPVSSADMRVSITRPVADIRVVAIDQISGMKSAAANDIPLIRDPLNSSVWTMQGFSFPHGYTTVVLTAKDTDENVDTVSITVKENTDPVIDHPELFPAYFYAGTLYSDTIVAVDRENDSAILQTNVLPRNMSCVPAGFNRWRLSYAPTASDTGSKDVTFAIRDNFSEKQSLFDWKFVVFKDASTLVRFQTTASVFPQVLEVGKDTLRNVLSVVNGCPQYHFTVGFLGASTLLYSSISPQGSSPLVWAPQLSDTGYHQLLIIVKDSVGVCDTIIPLPAITVVPPNRACTLKVSHTIPMWGNALDLTNVTSPETLFCSIIDPDLATYDHHTVKIRFPTTKSEFTIDTSKAFIVVLLPDMFALGGLDSVNISIADMAGHKDSISYPILIGARKDVIVQTIQNGSPIIAGDVYNFPLLIRLNSGNFNFAKAMGNASDIRFTKQDGSPLSFEIERYDSTLQVAEIWVRVDTIFANNNMQAIKITSGNNAALPSTGTKPVFDTLNGYQGVWHVSDALKGQNQNSAQNAYNGVLGSPPGQTALRTGSGIIAFADSFTNGSYISVGTLPTPQKVTLSLWACPAIGTPYAKLLCKPWTGYTPPYVIYSLEEMPTSTTSVQFFCGTSTVSQIGAAGNNVMPLNTWTNLVGTFDGTTMKLYVNGVLYTTQQYGPVTVPENSIPWNIGAYSQHSTECFTGKLDEVRICNQPLSADEIRLNYETQKPGSTMVQIQ